MTVCGAVAGRSALAGGRRSTAAAAGRSVRHEQVLVLAGRVRPDRPQSEAGVQPVQRQFAAGVSLMSVTDCRAARCGRRLHGTDTAVAVTARTVAELAGERAVIEGLVLGARARVQVGRQELTGRLEHVAVRELRVVGPAVLEEVGAWVGGALVLLAGSRGRGQLVRGQRAAGRRALRGPALVVRVVMVMMDLLLHCSLFDVI